MIQRPHEKRGELYCCCMLGVSANRFVFFQNKILRTEKDRVCVRLRVMRAWHIAESDRESLTL